MDSLQIRCAWCDIDKLRWSCESKVDRRPLENKWAALPLSNSSNWRQSMFIHLLDRICWLDFTKSFFVLKKKQKGKKPLMTV